MPRPQKKTQGPHFGPGVIGEEEWKNQEKTIRKGHHHFGPGVIDLPEDEAAAKPGRADTFPEILQLDTKECIRELAKIHDPPRLEKLHHLELEREDTEPREKVLEFIERKIFREEGAGDEELPGLGEGLPRMLEGTVGEVKVTLQTVDSIDLLDVLEQEEQKHPEYEGGRKGVLRALEARKQELAG